VDNHWFKQAKKYLSLEAGPQDPGGSQGPPDESQNPGPIDNKPLWREDCSDIREHMIDEMDYVLVPEQCWNLLIAEFGLEENMEGTSTAVKRKVVEHGMFVKQFKVGLDSACKQLS
jgi:ubiquitin carboxyl-terminal hydrolase 4/11/15